MLGQRVGDFVEIVLGAVDADHGGIALAVVVVDVDGGDVLLRLHEEMDRFGGVRAAGLGVEEGLMDGFCREDEAVDGDQLLAGSELGFVGWAAPPDVVDGAVGA